MQLECRQAQFLLCCSSVESREDTCKFGRMGGLDASCRARLIESLKAFVAKAHDHVGLYRVSIQDTMNFRLVNTNEFRSRVVLQIRDMLAG